MKKRKLSYKAYEYLTVAVIFALMVIHTVGLFFAQRFFALKNPDCIMYASKSFGFELLIFLFLDLIFLGIWLFFAEMIINPCKNMSEKAKAVYKKRKKRRQKSLLGFFIGFSVFFAFILILPYFLYSIPRYELTKNSVIEYNKFNTVSKTYYIEDFSMIQLGIRRTKSKHRYNYALYIQLNGSDEKKFFFTSRRSRLAELELMQFIKENHTVIIDAQYLPQFKETHNFSDWNKNEQNLLDSILWSN